MICRIFLTEFLMALVQHSLFWMLLMNVLTKKSFLTGFSLWSWGKYINLGLHLIVTSHPEQEIEDKLKSYHYLDLVKESKNHDLRDYLDYQLQHDSGLQKWNSDIQKQIKLTLMKQADGMYVYQHLNDSMITKCNFRFCWVALQLNELKECRTNTDLNKQLANLPQGLDETYD